MIRYIQCFGFEWIYPFHVDKNHYRKYTLQLCKCNKLASEWSVGSLKWLESSLIQRTAIKYIDVQINHVFEANTGCVQWIVWSKNLTNANKSGTKLSSNHQINWFFRVKHTLSCSHFNWILRMMINQTFSQIHYEMESMLYLLCLCIHLGSSFIAYSSSSSRSLSFYVRTKLTIQSVKKWKKKQNRNFSCNLSVFFFVFFFLNFGMVPIQRQPYTITMMHWFHCYIFPSAHQLHFQRSSVKQ